MTHPSYADVLAALAERDRARRTAVALEQELAQVTRERDVARAELDRLRGNVGVLAEVTRGLPAMLDDLLTDEERAAAALPLAGTADREVADAPRCPVRPAEAGAVMTARPVTLPDGDPRHGANGYVGYGCRCQTCTEADRLRHQLMRLRHKANPLPASDPRHGSLSGYVTYACRCDACTEANRAYQRARRARRAAS